MTGILILSDLRRVTGKSARAINYAIEKYGPAPIARIGIVRVWPKSAIPEIRESLRKTSANCTRNAKAEAAK